MIAILLVFHVEMYLIRSGISTNGAFCSVKSWVVSTPETEKVYHNAEVIWADDERTLSQFQAFWENRDTCDPR